jgi:glucose/arabinose dehydrogenase
MVTFVNHNGTVTQRPFAEGWLNEGWLNKVGAYFGRPVDLQQLRDGSLLVSDDFAGAVYRVTYQDS